MIYQSGYLTIKGYDERFGIYRLGFPNREVEVGDYDSFFRRLQSCFADTPYKMVRELELHCQNILFIVFKLVGFYVKVEYHTVRGRVDLVLQTDRFIYVMEFKLDGTAEEALSLIHI